MVLRDCRFCNPFEAFANKVRSLVLKSLKRGEQTKSKNTEKYLTIPLPDFRAYIAGQFELGTFENQGKWHLDHRKPVAEFKREVEAGTIGCRRPVQPLYQLPADVGSGECRQERQARS